jgi:hypothetical protein
MGAGMSFIFAHRLPAVNSHQIRESNPAALRNTTAKKMNDKKINEGKTGISESYIHAVHLPVFIFFSPHLVFSSALVQREMPRTTRQKAAINRLTPKRNDFLPPSVQTSGNGGKEYGHFVRHSCNSCYSWFVAFLLTPKF